ncbi:MAG: hypothetical protein ACP5OA_04670 [Candidatus Woesearchaeota archaeon]
MPHSIKEEDLEDICANCKKPHGDNTTLKSFNHKVYEVILCQNCGYEIIRLIPEKEFSDKLATFHKV